MKCDHANCRCDEAELEQAGKRYCSQRCADAASTGESLNCACGHPDCAEV